MVSALRAINPFREVLMGPVSRQLKGLVTRKDSRRFVEIPEEFFLEGREVIILQDRDGTISIYPAEETAQNAMWARFNPFVEWADGIWPKNLLESDG